MGIQLSPGTNDPSATRRDFTSLLAFLASRESAYTIFQAFLRILQHGASYFHCMDCRLDQ
jgi:hypothetical protein